jgi:hypothetical protein
MSKPNKIYSLNRLEIAETSVGVLKSLREFEQGKGILLQVAFTQLRKQYNLPN